MSNDGSRAELEEVPPHAVVNGDRWIGFAWTRLGTASVPTYGLVRDSDCSAYDCEFVALALKLNMQLVTMNKKLLRAFPKCAVALVNES